MSGKIRIVLADDHPVVLAGLRNLLSSQPDFELVGEAQNGADALEVVTSQRPDVAILDISMPAINGLNLTRQLSEKCPETRVMILTFYEERGYVGQTISAGARGYVLKRTAAEHLLQGVRVIAAGGIFVDPAVAQSFLSTQANPRRSYADGGDSLTDRETEVLRCLALGQTYKSIAARMGLAVKSIETYKSRASAKLGLKTRAEIVRYATLRGWLSEAVAAQPENPAEPAV
jgi:DNA-binding NarL/FixJ family response regulator